MALPVDRVPCDARKLEWSLFLGLNGNAANAVGRLSSRHYISLQSSLQRLQEEAWIATGLVRRCFPLGFAAAFARGAQTGS